MDKQEPTFESAASSSAENAAAEAKAAPAAEAKTEPKAEAKAEPKTEPKAIDAEAVSPNRAGKDEKVHAFPLAIYKPIAQYRRFALLAASIALAAAFGGLVGSASTYGLTSTSTAKTEPVVDPILTQMQATLTKVTKDFAALKTSVDASSRSASSQAAKINERFDRVERAQAEPAAKIAALTETVSRLEKRITAKADSAKADPDTTGSVPDRAAAMAAAKDQSKPTIVEGWVLRDIYRGRALVEGRGELYEVMPGADLPGIGKVQNITQQNGRWVVVTPKGLIVSMR